MKFIDLDSFSEDSGRYFYLTAALMFASSSLSAHQGKYLISGLMAFSGVAFILAGYFEPRKDEEE